MTERYGGPPGTGFVRINGGGANGGPLPIFAEIQGVAEYQPQDLRSAR